MGAEVGVGGWWMREGVGGGEPMGVVKIVFCLHEGTSSSTGTTAGSRQDSDLSLICPAGPDSICVRAWFSPTCDRKTLGMATGMCLDILLPLPTLLPVLLPLPTLLLPLLTLLLPLPTFLLPLPPPLTRVL